MSSVRYENQSSGVPASLGHILYVTGCYTPRRNERGLEKCQFEYLFINEQGTFCLRIKAVIAKKALIFKLRQRSC